MSRGIFDINERITLRQDEAATTVRPTHGVQAISSGTSTDTAFDIGRNNQRIYFEAYVSGTSGTPDVDVEFWARSGLTGLMYLLGTAAGLEATAFRTSFDNCKWVKEVYAHLAITGTAAGHVYAFGDKG